MNKKYILILLLSYFAFSLNASETGIKDVSHPFYIQAGYKEVLELSITPLISQEESFATGMPFNIEDQALDPDSGIGRYIARWSFISNTPFSMSAVLYPLLHVHDETETECCNTQLWYMLGLNFSLSYYVDGVDEKTEGTFILSPKSFDSTGTEPPFDTGSNPDLTAGINAFMAIRVPPNMNYQTNEADPNKISIGVVLGETWNSTNQSFIGSSQDSIVFAFTSNTYAEIKKPKATNKVKSGRYAGSVKIILTSDI